MAEDALVYDDPANPQRFHWLQTSEDGRWAVLGGRLTQPLSGHLGHEPAMLPALRQSVRRTLA